MQTEMYKTLTLQFIASATNLAVRRDYEVAYGNVSWNDAIDYEYLFDNRTEPVSKAVVEALYQEAGLDLKADLARINAAPRITANPDAVKYINELASVNGTPGVPVLVIHTIGDPSPHAAIQEAYQARVRVMGKEDLLRITFVRAAGHCNFTTAEYAAAVETMMRRLDTGQWGDSTTPDAMNALGKTLDKSETHFTDYRLGEFNRPSYANTEYRLGGVGVDRNSINVSSSISSAQVVAKCTASATGNIATMWAYDPNFDAHVRAWRAAIGPKRFRDWAEFREHEKRITGGGNPARGFDPGPNSPAMFCQ